MGSLSCYRAPSPCTTPPPTPSFRTESPENKDVVIQNLASILRDVQTKNSDLETQISTLRNENRELQEKKTIAETLVLAHMDIYYLGASEYLIIHLITYFKGDMQNEIKKLVDEAYQKKTVETFFLEDLKPYIDLLDTSISYPESEEDDDTNFTSQKDSSIKPSPSESLDIAKEDIKETWKQLLHFFRLSQENKKETPLMNIAPEATLSYLSLAFNASSKIFYVASTAADIGGKFFQAFGIVSAIGGAAVFNFSPAVLVFRGLLTTLRAAVALI